MPARRKKTFPPPEEGFFHREHRSKKGRKLKKKEDYQNKKFKAITYKKFVKNIDQQLKIYQQSL